MKRDVIISAVIGILATYLPFFQWTGTAQQICGAVSMGILAFVPVFATDKITP